MLNWIRDKFLRRQSVSNTFINHTEVDDPISSSSQNSTLQPNMLDDQLSSIEQNNSKIILHIIHEGETWTVNADRQQVISDLINMAMGHFFDPKESHKLISKYKFILISPKRVLQSQSTVDDERLKHNDEVLLVASITTGATVPLHLTLQDIKGPSHEEIFEATKHLTLKNAIQFIPLLDCPESFLSEIRRVLYSLVEASAKILSQSPDAKVVFDGISARIRAKNKKEFDKAAVKYLTDLGFTEVQARYALSLKRNRQVEAMEWLLENSHRMQEAFTESAEAASTSANDSPSSETPDDPLHTINKLLQDIRDFNLRHFEPSGRALESLLCMGFSREDCIEALRACSNNQVTACEWLCGERDPTLPKPEEGLETDSTIYKALISNPTIQLGLHNPKIMLAFLSILENPSSANLWLNDVDASPVLGQVFKTYHSEKHMMMINQQVELMKKKPQQK